MIYNPLSAQQADKLVYRIVNIYNQPVEHAKVRSQDGTYETVTTREGTFEFPTEYLKGHVLLTADGYLNARIAPEQFINQKDFTLQFDAHNMGERLISAICRIARNL